MQKKHNIAVTSWLITCAALITAVAFADQGREPVAPNPALLSPVIVTGAAPTLELRSIVRRSDI